MKRIKHKPLAVLIVISLIVASLMVFSFGCMKKEEKEIKIGAILPLTGDFAILGEEIKKGIELAIEETKSTGLPLIVFYEDDQSLSPVAGVNAANKLITVNKIDVGLTMIVEESRPISSFFGKSKVPLIVLWDSNKFIKEDGEYIFSNGFSTEKAGEKMAEFAFSKLGLRKFAIIKHVDPWAEIISESVETKIRNSGGTIVLKETLQPTDTDYRTAISKIKKAGPDSVYVALVPPNSSLFLIQAKELGVRVPLLTGDALIQQVIDAAGKSAEGAYLTNIYTESNNATLLTEKYKNKYKKAPFDIALVSFGYDGIMKVAEAMKLHKRTLQEALISIFGENRSADRIEKIYRIINGKPVEVEVE
ncbi:MAG: ABC transporter substrate-binding protein [Nitrospirae bacterium]|nr:ABC transporter substrate-binding protein [Nitrospirota bacterium]